MLEHCTKNQVFVFQFNRWLTCDDEGLIKIWRQSIDSPKPPPLIMKVSYNVVRISISLLVN